MENEKTYMIQVKGLVQGVGFRPFIYRIAHQHKFKGWVENRNDGVLIHVNGIETRIKNFVNEIQSHAPPAANISRVSFHEIESEYFSEFTIVKSKSTSEAITDVSPDIAVCDDCLEDLKTQKHRFDYPFINCTNCGPRFTIIQDLPYDRHKTTMDPFVMCDTCRKEYENVTDRRFHAQPVACLDCGPVYELLLNGETYTEFDKILDKTTAHLAAGGILALKGVGGFQIACDARNETAVSRLRKLKNREGKPFAVLFRDMEAAEEFADLSTEEKRVLASWRRPIVIVAAKNGLAASVSAGFSTVGAMLPYMPFHYLLFEKLELPVLVLTSGNISDEPIVIDNDEAKSALSKITNAILVYNREIHNRTDDSVVMTINEKERIIRRSRGYSPEPVNMVLNTEGIFAAGAELVNCFALGKGNQAIVSQHIGDLKNLETLDFYSESYERYKNLFRVKPTLAVHDKHPDYLSTRFARDLGIPTMAVQHHHAHIASCMAEHGVDEQVIGISMDGTGLGDDGQIWGGEFLVCDLSGYKRYSHFDYIPLPGGDKVTHEPWRTGVAYLYSYFGKQVFTNAWPFLRAIDPHHVDLMCELIDKKINAPLSCSAGRLFDAVAAITNVCGIAKFHAEAPMRLEAIAARGITTEYPYDVGEVISFRATFEKMVEEILEGISPSIISARFHNTIIRVMLDVSTKISNETGIKKIMLSGGTFQNKYIVSRLEPDLEEKGFTVYAQQRMPSNDGGIALGQLAIAAKCRALGLIGQQSDSSSMGLGKENFQSSFTNK